MRFQLLGLLGDGYLALRLPAMRRMLFPQSDTLLISIRSYFQQHCCNSCVRLKMFGIQVHRRQTSSIKHSQAASNLLGRAQRNCC